MHRPHPTPYLFALLTLTAFAASGCTIDFGPGDAGRSWPSPHPGAAGGADLGPLIDAQGRRRSLVLAPADGGPQGGIYAARNDARRSVTAGYRSATYLTAQTTTIDRGPGGGGNFGRRHGLRDGYSTRTVRRTYSEAIR